MSLRTRKSRDGSMLACKSVRAQLPLILFYGSVFSPFFYSTKNHFIGWRSWQGREMAVQGLRFTFSEVINPSGKSRSFPPIPSSYPLVWIPDKRGKRGSLTESQSWLSCGEYLCCLGCPQKAERTVWGRRQGCATLFWKTPFPVMDFTGRDMSPLLPIPNS